MLYGEAEEKMRQSFDLLDIRKNKNISYNDFKDVTLSFAQMWSAAIG